MRMKRVPHLSLSSVFINVGGGKHSVSHPANASCTEPAGANSFIYYIARLDSEKPDHPVMARRERREKKESSVCVSQVTEEKQPRAPNMFVASEHPDGAMINFVLIIMTKGRLVVKVKKETKTTAFLWCIIFLSFFFF